MSIHSKPPLASVGHSRLIKELEARRVPLAALNGMAFDLSTPHGRMMATLLAGIAAAKPGTAAWSRAAACASWR